MKKFFSKRVLAYVLVMCICIMSGTTNSVKAATASVLEDIVLFEDPDEAILKADESDKDDEVITPKNDSTTLSGSEAKGLVETASSTPIATGATTITNSATINVSINKTFWNRSFYCGVMGNQGAQYEVVMYDTSGNSYRKYITGGSSNLSLIVNLFYVPSGNYRFEFTRISGYAVSASAIIEVH